MKTIIKISRKTNTGEVKIGIMELDSEKDKVKQIKNFVYDHGVNFEKDIIIVEEITWADFIKEESVFVTNKKNPSKEIHLRDSLINLK